MSRAEIEKAVEPIIRRNLRELEYTPEDVPDKEYSVHTDGMFRPDVRRVSLILSMAQSVLGADTSGEGLEVGSAYGYLVFSAAALLPRIQWMAVDHPGRSYRHADAYEKAFREHKCGFVATDICAEPLPFASGRFAVVTFSEVLEHLPVERVNFVLGEIARVIRPGGVLLASSPNQASIENRLKLLKGKSILAMPDKVESAGEVFGHIRLYTPGEIKASIAKLGFTLEGLRMETNISGYRGTAGSWRRRMYRMYERLEERLEVLQTMADTWYMAFRKN